MRSNLRLFLLGGLLVALGLAMLVSGFASSAPDGLNILNMALVTTWGGYAVFLLLRRVLPATKASMTAAAGVAAGVSVVLASLAFVVEYAIGGTGGAPVAAVLGAMAGVHTLIGIGEGVITALTVAAVLAVRPDLVHGAADLQTPLVLDVTPDEVAEEVG